MKRILLSLFIMLLPLMASAYDVEIDGIYYNLYTDDMTAEVTCKEFNYKSYSGSVSIPASITSSDLTYSVTSIGSNAFYNCSGLTSLEIPYSVTSIEGAAFYNCSGLTSIEIPNSVTNIDDCALMLCTGLTSIEIPNSVTSIGGYAFKGCSNLTSIIIPNSVTSIGPEAFDETEWYNNQPSGLVYAGLVVYKYKGSPQNIVLKENTKGIAGGAFSNCTNLTSIEIPNSVTNIGFEAFSGCTGLTEVALNSNFIVSKTYSSSSNIKNIFGSQVKKYIIGSSVTSIGKEAFSGCNRLSSIEIPNSLKEICAYAFYGCDNLTTLSIPGSVTEIGQQAFDLCRSLKTLSFEDGIETLAFTALENNLNNAFQNSPLEDIYMGRNISFTNSSPLSIFESLKTLTIGSEVTHVADKAFIGCPNLKDVTSYAKIVPTTGEVVFTPSYLPTATLHVPYELYSQYKVTPQWQDFGNIVNFEGMYNLTYIVDGEVYNDFVVEQNSPLTPEEEPTKEGYTFSGWSLIPETMPAHDVTITGSFTLVDAIEDVIAEDNTYEIYTLDGKPVETLQKGVNIIKFKNGATQKIYVK